MLQASNLASKVPSRWLDTNGKGVRVGVIDTNCRPELCATHKLFGYNSNIGHGEAVVSIIKDKSVCGLASDSEIFFAGISTTQSMDYDYLRQALEWIARFDVDVLNMSFAYRDDNRDVLSALRDMPCVKVAACSGQLPYPHSYPGVIGVDSKPNTSASISAPGVFHKEGVAYSGSSFSCAYVSSIAALAKSFEKDIMSDMFLSEMTGFGMVRHGPAQGKRQIGYK